MTANAYEQARARLMAAYQKPAIERCLARGCRKDRTMARRGFCAAHWAVVPEFVRERIEEEYREGAPEHIEVTDPWGQAVMHAQAEIAIHEGGDAPAIHVWLSKHGVRPKRPVLMIVNCNEHNRRPPRGCTYIGRAMPGLAESRLANNFVDVPNPLEKYRRWLCREVIQGHRQLAALRDIHYSATLACWCVSRPAALVRHGLALPDTLCHADIVYTVWTTLRERGRAPQADFFADFEHANQVHREFYEECFGAPMLWGNDYARGAKAIELPSIEGGQAAP